MADSTGVIGAVASILVALVGIIIAIINIRGQRKIADSTTNVQEDENLRKELWRMVNKLKAFNEELESDNEKLEAANRELFRENERYKIEFVTVDIFKVDLIQKSNVYRLRAQERIAKLESALADAARALDRAAEESAAAELKARNDAAAAELERAARRDRRSLPPHAGN